MFIVAVRKTVTPVWVGVCICGVGDVEKKYLGVSFASGALSVGQKKKNHQIRLDDGKPTHFSRNQTARPPT